MTQKIRTLILFTYIETLSHIRVKESFFFGFVFPVFIFILFGSIWGNVESTYAKSLLFGVIAMTITSDSMFGIGPVMRIYKANNILKFLRNLPLNILYHFLGFFLSRILIMFFAVFLLFICAMIFFDTRILLDDIILSLIGIILGMTMFGFLSLNISFFSKSEMGRGSLNFIFFIMLFLSGAFYPINMLPDIVKPLSYLLPLTHLINFLRGDLFYFWIILFWITVFGMLFYYLFNRLSFFR